MRRPQEGLYMHSRLRHQNFPSISGGKQGRRTPRDVKRRVFRRRIFARSRSRGICLRVVTVLLGFTSLLSFLLLPFNRSFEYAQSQQSWLGQQQKAFLEQNLDRPLLLLTAFTEDPPLIQSDERPLPLRIKPKLEKFVYPQVSTCQDIPENWPVDHFHQINRPGESESSDLREQFGSNAGEIPSLFDKRRDYAEKVCPVDLDPFLPWIHDVFVSYDGGQVEFVAHNKRRCRTAPSFRDKDLKNLEPQVALFQSVPIQRLHNRSNWNQTHLQHETFPRYKLSSLSEADMDSQETRFLCQFHTLRPNTNGKGWEKDMLAETTSRYPYNYEYDNYKKGKNSHPLLTRPNDDKDIHGAHNEQIWNSILQFSCPIPKKLQNDLANHPVSDSSRPWLYLDLAPIRTRPRETREGYTPQLQQDSKTAFDPQYEWGDAHILPLVEDSGRWANIPVCPTSTKQGTAIRHKTKGEKDATKPQDKHFIAGCVWSSAVFQTRGKDAPMDNSTSDRLLEWLTYHLYIAKLDHIYVYDNTGAFTNETSLKIITDLFPKDRVTRISWSPGVCNNNRPGHSNAGERSSQYAAEASCRGRYGPKTEWMIFFDTDEYLIAQYPWTNLKEWLINGTANGSIDSQTQILSFYQTRARPNIKFMTPFSSKKTSGGKCRGSEVEAACLQKDSNTSFLRAYDCEPTPLPKPDYGWRAKKQLFRPSFVLNHFVHYSTVTRRIIDAPKEMSPPFKQRQPFERRVDELNEAFMLHTKTTHATATWNWGRNCRNSADSQNCPVGIAWPTSPLKIEDKVNQDGFAFNCYTHSRIQEEIAPVLEGMVNDMRLN